MKQQLILASVTVFTLLGCSDTNDIDTSDIDTSKELFHGKYEMIYAVSDIAVDLNMDGIPSRDLMDENPELLHSQVELRIDKNTNLYSETWPIEHIGTTSVEFDSSRYDPSYIINYSFYVIISKFQFAENQTAIDLIDAGPIIVNGVVDTRFVFPDEINVDQDAETITLVSTRNLFTFNGYVEVEVTTKYRRYTRIT